MANKHKETVFDTASFIKKAVSTHKNVYDYTLVSYANFVTKINIKCQKHGMFMQTPAAHLSGQGCPECGRIKSELKRRSNSEEFISRSSVKHKNKYDYSLVNYVECKTKVEIICPKHGVFKQSPTGHLSGKGCKKCAHELTPHNQLTTKTFVEKAKKIFGTLYDYSLVEYELSQVKVRIVCKRHGPFEVTPNNHLRDMGGCPKCSMEKRSEKRRCSLQEIIDRAVEKHGNKYDYSKVAYKGNNVKIEIICPQHGSFFQAPNSHLCGKGCPICGRWSLLTTDIFKERSIKIHGNKKYDYSLVDYKNSRSKVKIICPKHGVFEQMAQNHLKGSGCFLCLESQGEKKICLYLEAHRIISEREKSFEGCRDKNPLQFDFYLSDYNTCIEFDGLQHFQPVDYFGGEAAFEKTKKSDAIKNDFCKKIGINLIRIPYKKYSEIDLILDKEIANLSLQKVA